MAQALTASRRYLGTSWRTASASSRIPRRCQSSRRCSRTTRSTRWCDTRCVEVHCERRRGTRLGADTQARFRRLLRRWGRSVLRMRSLRCENTSSMRTLLSGRRARLPSTRSCSTTRRRARRRSQSELADAAISSLQASFRSQSLISELRFSTASTPASTPHLPLPTRPSSPPPTPPPSPPQPTSPFPSLSASSSTPS